MSSTSAVSQRRRKRMRTFTRSTPWKDSYELDTVGRSLLLATRLLSPAATLLSDAEKAELYHALVRVNMWKARSDQGRIPHSMETTFALAQVAWRDATSTSTASSMELRMAYSTAVMRGVNGLADALQQNRAYAASVASLCEQVGLPGWIVDIRHEAAHNDLPSLSVLRLAAKTFLGYLEERYWVPLANSRQERRETAVELLVKYKEKCKKNTMTDDSAEKQNVDTNITSGSSSNEESDLDEDNEWGKSLGTNQNRFAVFLEDTSEPKDARKKRKKEVSKKNEKDINSDSKQAVHSALHFAKVFVRDIPIDVGYQVALSFLVWGGVGEAPTGRGVLIPGSPASFPASEEGIQRVRNRYKPLILVLCNAWPGFLQALLIHLVDHVISVEAASAGEGLDAGSERKLYFLASWIRFLVSREFHVHFDESVGLYGRQDLSKESCAKWTKAERDFVESPAPYSVLSRAGLPLNSLCDRCLSASPHDHVNGSHALGVKLNDILGNDRVWNCGVQINNGGDRGSQRGEASVAESPLASRLSVDEVEMILGNEMSHEAVQEKASTSNTWEGEASVPSVTVKNPWSRCATWDACSIGSLPGHPV